MANCAYCGEYFKPKSNGQMFCGRPCANRDKATWKKPAKKKDKRGKWRMGKGSIDLEKIIKQTARETVKELEKAKLIKYDGATYFQKTEKLLYNYNELLQAVKQKEADIEFLKTNGLQAKSKSIVFYSTGSGSNGADQYVEVLESYQAAKERTERLISKIDRALDEIKLDSKYYIIQEKYFSEEKPSNEEISERYKVSERTVRRHKNRLINKLQVLLFGADALDILD